MSGEIIALDFEDSGLGESFVTDKERDISLLGRLKGNKRNSLHSVCHRENETHTRFVPSYV